MPQLLTCSSQLFFLLCFVSSPCDLQRWGKKQKTILANGLWPFRNSGHRGHPEHLCPCTSRWMFSCQAALAVQASNTLGAETCRAVTGTAPTGRTALFCPFTIIFSKLTLKTYFGAFAYQPVCLSDLGARLRSAPPVQGMHVQCILPSVICEHPFSVRIPMSKLGSVLVTGGRRECCEPTGEVSFF